jgi:hypothetical protein
MKESTEKQMYIVTADCYKCGGNFNLAMIKGDEKRNGFCGPEAFTQQEIKLAQNHGVNIQKQNSQTMQESYFANTCPHCNAFTGQHFLFSEYFVSAIEGDFEFITVDLI